VISRHHVTAGTWTHIFVTYEGSSRAAGLKIYIDGELQSTDTQTDSLSQPIRTQVPLKLGQRHMSSRIDEMVIHSVRLYDRAISKTEAAFLAGVSKTLDFLKTPAGKRTSDVEASVFTWWRSVLDPASQKLRERLGRLEIEEAEIKGRSTV